MVIRVCDRCNSKMSHYQDVDRLHEVWLCWGCGKFDGNTKINDSFNDVLTFNPMLIIDMIEDKHLKPVK
jgi:hypothetical protein